MANKIELFEMRMGEKKMELKGAAATWEGDVMQGATEGRSERANEINWKDELNFFYFIIANSSTSVELNLPNAEQQPSLFLALLLHKQRHNNNKTLITSWQFI